MAMVTKESQPLTGSETRTVYVVAQRPVTVLEPWPVPGGGAHS